MKILVIGATGTIGSAVSDALSERHEVLRVAHSRGELRVDLTSKDSIEGLYREVGRVDAVVSAAGKAAFKPLAQLDDEDFRFSLSHKLMGQVNLVRVGLAYLTEGGSFTLTSGVLSVEPEPGAPAISLVNSALEGFGRAAALELPAGTRINVVSPPWVTETLEAYGMDTSRGIPARQVARAYVESVESARTGEVLDARRFGG